MAYRPPRSLLPFTLDIGKTKVRDDAISVEMCRTHKDCKRIGIHIFVVPRRGKVDWTEIPSFGRMWKIWNSERRYREDIEEGFVEGGKYRALSVFVHTNDKLTEGPMKLDVRIGKNYLLQQLEKWEEWAWQILWKCFVGDVLEDKFFNSKSSRYVLCCPHAWRDAVLLDCIAKKYYEIIKRYTTELNGVYFIVSEENKYHLGAEVPVVTVFEDEIHRAAISDGDAGSITRLICRVFQFLKPVGNDKFHFPQRYQSDVQSTLQDSIIVKCTSPLGDFKQFLNQQILIQAVEGRLAEPLYSKDDLLGLLVPRFQTPTLSPALFQRFSSDGFSIVLDYVISQNIASSLGVLKISEFLRQRSEKSEFEMAKINYFNLFCADEDYCNRNLAHFDYAIQEELVVKWRKREDLTDILQKVDRENAEEISPYQCNVKNGERLGTILTLKRGAELQMQISRYEVRDHGVSLGLRMLRIGKNCHLCFTHVNYPDKAFLSDRSDVRRLITDERIIALQQATTDEILASSKHFIAEIEWYGDYMGGGSFLIRDAEYVDARDLLCIRKEIFDGGRLQYIWCCHGVVKSVHGNRVQFATCTLSQTQDSLPYRNFCVTVIHPKIIESKVDARQRTKRRNTM